MTLEAAVRSLTLCVPIALAGGAHAQSIYGVTFGGDLVQLDAATGSITTIGATGLDRNGGLDMGTDGTLYTYTTPDGAGSQSSLYTVDRSTGAATLVGALGVDFEFEGGLTIVDATTAYALGGRDNDAGAALFRVDLTTGAATEVGSLGNRDIDGLTRRSDGMLVAWSHLGGQVLAIDPATAGSTVIESGFEFSRGNVGGLASIDGSQAYLVYDFATSSGSQNATMLRFDMFTGEIIDFTEFGSSPGIAGIAIPAPAGSVLLALGGLAATRRRR